MDTAKYRSGSFSISLIVGRFLKSIVCVFSFLLIVTSGIASAMSLRELYSKPVSDWPAPTLAKGVTYQPLGKPAPLSKATPELWKLGYALFFEPMLSKSGQFACASCHDSENGWGDGRSVAIGHNRQIGHRNTMTILNSMYFQDLFWDGRAESPQAQALMPITNPIEMAADLDEVIHSLQKSTKYKALFKAAFATEDIQKQHLSEALVAFQRTVVSRPSRFDLFVAGRHDVLSDQEIEGLHLFRTKAGCMNCHSGPLFSDAKFHHTGLSYFGRRFEDLGLYEHTKKDEDKGKFRTPSLRDVTFTGPWMHNGLFPDLMGILKLYNRGITFARKDLKPGEPELSPLIKPRGLEGNELIALEAFLHSISSRPRVIRPPRE